MLKNVEISFNLKFIIGVLYGFINRKDKDLILNTQAEGKEDIEQTILYYLKDKKIMRYNHITFKTQMLAKGGLGKDRFIINEKASQYIHNTYPNITKIKKRKNGMCEIKLIRM
jgi:hypothetical protein